MLCIASALHASGQSTLNATGGSAYIGGNEYEWSVGEMALVNTFTTSSIIVTQGVLQTGLKEATALQITELNQHIKVYPNPASNNVFINYESANSSMLGLRLSDVTGKIISQQQYPVKMGSNVCQLNVSNLAAATYLLQVDVTMPNGKTLTVPYKIQKLQ